jgi:hypothetical protein
MAWKRWSGGKWILVESAGFRVWSVQLMLNGLKKGSWLKAIDACMRTESTDKKAGGN